MYPDRDLCDSPHTLGRMESDSQPWRCEAAELLSVRIFISLDLSTFH